MASELKPCICGKTPRLNRKKGSAGITKTPFYREQIVCRCGVTSKIFKAPNKAVEAWNTRPAPAATDTGLETVAWTNKAQLGFLKDDQWKVKPMAMWAKDYVSASNDDIALCRCSQAAELLTAERAKTERWHKKAMDAGVIVHSDGTTSHPMRKELDDLKADNAAQAVRIKELEEVHLDAADVEPGEHQEILDALEAHNSGEEQ